MTCHTPSLPLFSAEYGALCLWTQATARPLVLKGRWGTQRSSPLCRQDMGAPTLHVPVTQLASKYSLDEGQKEKSSPLRGQPGAGPPTQSEGGATDLALSWAPSGEQVESQRPGLRLALPLPHLGTLARSVSLVLLIY